MSLRLLDCEISNNSSEKEFDLENLLTKLRKLNFAELKFSLNLI